MGSAFDRGGEATAIEVGALTAATAVVCRFEVEVGGFSSMYSSAFAPVEKTGSSSRIGKSNSALTCSRRPAAAAGTARCRLVVLADVEVDGEGAAEVEVMPCAVAAAAADTVAAAAIDAGAAAAVVLFAPVVSPVTGSGSTRPG